jgi:hypothetical protein
VLGYGTEGVIDFWGARNWTWKTGVTTGAHNNFVNICCITGTSCTSGGQVTTHSHFTDGILRAGLNYKFY